MLVKQVWRLLVNPSSLAAQILCSKYYSHNDVLTAKFGSKPSYLWRSLMTVVPPCLKLVCFGILGMAKKCRYGGINGSWSSHLAIVSNPLLIHSPVRQKYLS